METVIDHVESVAAKLNSYIKYIGVTDENRDLIYGVHTLACAVKALLMVHGARMDRITDKFNEELNK